MKIKPLGARVVIKPDSQEEKTESGIILPGTIEKEKPEQGTVIAVGPGKIKNGKKCELAVKNGDKVLFSQYGPSEIKIDGEEMLVVSEDDILAVLE